MVKKGKEPPRSGDPKPVIDELTKRRFVRISNNLGKAEQELEIHIRGMSAEAANIERYLIDFLDELERISGPTAETKQIRTEVETAFEVFGTSDAMAAVNAGQRHFSDAADNLARLVGALVSYDGK